MISSSWLDDIILLESREKEFLPCFSKKFKCQLETKMNFLSLSSCILSLFFLWIQKEEVATSLVDNSSVRNRVGEEECFQL